MVQEVAKIKIFPEEQIQLSGIASINDMTAPMWGVARIGDKKPTDFRKNISPIDKIPNRIPRIPCQFVVIAFDNVGTKISGGDVKDGFLYNGVTLPNGNAVELKYSATMKNGKWCGSGVTPPQTYGDDRDPQAFIEESAAAGDPPTKWLGFWIDDTGLLMPGNDGILTIPANTEIGDTKKKFNPYPGKRCAFAVDTVCQSDPACAFRTDRTCDGFVKVDYTEIKPDKTKTNLLPQVQIKAVIAQPDWAVEKYTPQGWSLP